MEIINLVSRNINCSELTADEFASMMIEDMIKAKDIYDSIWYPIMLERHNERIESHKNIIYEIAKKYAEKHWKTEKKRNEYIENELNKLINSPFKYNTITYFDFDVNPGSLGISNNCILSYNNLSKEAMIRCFNEIKDNKYWKSANGWILEDHHGFRPQIKLILNKDNEDNFKHDAKVLLDAMNKFYEGDNWTGD